MLLATLRVAASMIAPEEDVSYDHQVRATTLLVENARWTGVWHTTPVAKVWVSHPAGRLGDDEEMDLLDASRRLRSAEKDGYMNAGSSLEIQQMLERLVESLEEGPRTGSHRFTSWYDSEDSPSAEVRRCFEELGVVQDPNASVANAELGRRHEDWCADNGLNAEVHWKHIAAALRRMGAQQERSHGERRWSGIALVGKETSASA